MTPTPEPFTASAAHDVMDDVPPAAHSQQDLRQILTDPPAAHSEPLGAWLSFAIRDGMTPLGAQALGLAREVGDFFAGGLSRASRLTGR